MRRPGPRRAPVLAVGDGQNDVELLRSAAVACAISDGCAEVLGLAVLDLL